MALKTCRNSCAVLFLLRHGFAVFGRSGVQSLGFGVRSSVFKGAPAKPCKLWGSGCAMEKLQKGAWPQKPVSPAKAARACFRRFFAAHTPSPKPAHQAAHSQHPKLANQASQPTNAKREKFTDQQSRTTANTPPLKPVAHARSSGWRWGCGAAPCGARNPPARRSARAARRCRSWPTERAWAAGR